MAAHIELQHGQAPLGKGSQRAQGDDNKDSYSRVTTPGLPRCFYLGIYILSPHSFGQSPALCCQKIKFINNLYLLLTKISTNWHSICIL